MRLLVLDVLSLVALVSLEVLVVGLRQSILLMDLGDILCTLNKDTNISIKIPAYRLGFLFG
jgi:hypothetical protein